MSEDNHLAADSTRRLVLGLVALVQGIVLFFGAQVGLRIFALRDQITAVETQVARIEERQANYALLFQNKIDNLRFRLNRLENNLHDRLPNPQGGASAHDPLMLPTRGDDGPAR